jgi:cytochrome b561
MKSLASSHYTRTAVSLHWLIAAFILAALFMGWTMTSMEFSPGKLKLVNYHKWVGVTVLALVLLRISWRLSHRPPPLEPMPRWQQFAAHAGHGLLYLLMVAVPCFGLSDRVPRQTSATGSGHKRQGAGSAAGGGAWRLGHCHGGHCGAACACGLAASLPA